MNQPQTTNWRYDINYLQRHKKDQFRQFHILLRLLHIFQADKQDQIDFLFNLNFWIRDEPNQGQPPIYITSVPKSVTVSPKCMYDCLVSFHANSCEHSIQFFPYWHRWHLLKYESYLLKAHQTLVELNEEKITKESQRLLKYVQNKSITGKIIAKKLTQVKDHYLQVLKRLDSSNLSYIGAHYWNLMDFNNVISYPKGYTSRQQRNEYPQIHAADDLINLVWNQDGIYEINIYTRYGVQARQVKDSILQQKKKQGRSLIQKFQPLINDQFFWKNPTLNKNVSDLINQIQIYVGWRQYFQRTEGKTFKDLNIIRFNILNQNEVDFIFGGKKHKYFSLQDIDQRGISLDIYDSKQQIAEKLKKHEKLQQNRTLKVFKEGRNQQIPYWNYGLNLKTLASDFLSEFCTLRGHFWDHSIQQLHNIAHLKQGFFLNHGSFSVVNPIFFAYHGFIDLTLEFRITQFQNPKSEFKPMIQKISIVTNDQDEAVTNIRKFLNSFVPNNMDTQFTRSGRIAFRQNWRTQRLSNGHIVKFSDYPVTKAIDYKNNKTFHEAEYKYQYLMLKKIGADQQGLRNLYDINKIKYQLKQSNFQKNCLQIFKNTPFIYVRRQQSLKIRLIITRQKITNETFFVNLIWKNQVIAKKTVTIFDRDEDCPNCPSNKVKQLYVYFPIYLIKKYLQNLGNNLNQVLSVQTTSFLNIKASVVYNTQAARFLIPRQYYGGSLSFVLTFEDQKTKKRTQYLKQHTLNLYTNKIYQSKQLQLDPALGKLIQVEFILEKPGLEKKAGVFEVTHGASSISIKPISLKQKKTNKRRIFGSQWRGQTISQRHPRFAKISNQIQKIVVSQRQQNKPTQKVEQIQGQDNQDSQDQHLEVIKIGLNDLTELHRE